MNEINWGLIRNGAQFESLVSSLIFFEDPKARVFGRSGRDDGQDIRSGDDTIVYQAKFHRSESVTDAIQDAKKEIKKIEEYLNSSDIRKDVWQGVKKWILVSNASFNPRDHKKWVDEIQSEFSRIGLDAEYWEKGHIEALLHKYPDLKQAYFGGETRVFLSLKEAKEAVRYREDFYPIAWDVNYQGRTDEIDQFKNFISNSEKRILIIHGSGGIGKTRFLLEAGTEVGATPQNEWNVLWADVETMKLNSSWFNSLLPEKPTLLLIDDPEDVTVLKSLIEQLSFPTSRVINWKVAITVCSQKDPVLGFFRKVRIKRLMEFLPLEELTKDAAKAFCLELFDLGYLKNRSIDWKQNAAHFITERYNCYPIWIAIAVRLLESQDSLEEMPQETEELASEYLQEIILSQNQFSQELVLNLLRWISLIDTVNTENKGLMELIKECVNFPYLTDLLRCIESLIQRKVVFTRGAWNRLLEVKPDILSEYILRDWLTYSVSFGKSGRHPTSQAQELINDLWQKLECEEKFGDRLLILRGIANFEFSQNLADDPVDLLGTFIRNLSNRLSTLNAFQKLKFFDIVQEISIAHVSEALRICRLLLSSSSEPVTVSTLFGEQNITQDNVTIALPWLVYNIATYATATQDKNEVISLLCELIIKENEIEKKYSKTLPNNGRRAKDLLPQIIEGRSDFLSNFEESAFNQTKRLLTKIRTEGLSKANELLFNPLIFPLLEVERQQTSFDGKKMTIDRGIIAINSSEWNRRDELRSEIREILSECRLQSSEKSVLWLLLDHAHSSANGARRDEPENESISQKILDDLLKDLEWTAEYIESNSPKITELRAAREIWIWHYNFDQDTSLKQAANHCEELFRKNKLFEEYDPLLSFSNLESMIEQSQSKAQELANANRSNAIHEFVRNGVEYLGNLENLKRIFTVATFLGKEAPNCLTVQKFVEEAFQSSTHSPQFEFATEIARSWVWTARENNSQEASGVFGKLLQWITNDDENDEKIIHLTRNVYHSSWLGNITNQEAQLVYGQYTHFENKRSNIQFLNLIGGMAFANLSNFKNNTERILDQLDDKHLSEGVMAFLEPLHFAIKSESDQSNNLVEPSLGIWLLDQILRLPDLDRLSNNAIWHLNEILKRTGRPSLSWLVNSVKQRIEMFEKTDTPTVSILPKRKRLSSLIEPISENEMADQSTRELIYQLISYSTAAYTLQYAMPQYLADIDPSGQVVADIVIEKFSDPDVKKDPGQVLTLARFAGVYSQESSAWRRIAHEACLLSASFDTRYQSSILLALRDSEPKVWVSTLGGVSSTVEADVEVARQRKEEETDPILLPFRELELSLAEAELENQLEIAKEERGE